MQGETAFKVFNLINQESVIGYPYIGIDSKSNRVIFIDSSHISIDEIHVNDRVSFEEDYVPTDKSFEFDIAFLNDIIFSYFGRSDFTLTGYFNKDKEITITFGKYESYKEVDLSTKTHLTGAGKEITVVIHQLLDTLKEQYF